MYHGGVVGWKATGARWCASSEASGPSASTASTPEWPPASTAARHLPVAEGGRGGGSGGADRRAVRRSGARSAGSSTATSTAAIDVSPKTLEQYRWAARTIEAGIGGIRLDRLEREDVGLWLTQLAADGHFSKRSIQIFRNVLRAALADAVDEGILRRSPAARVALPRAIAKPPKIKEADAWTSGETERFLLVRPPGRSVPRR